MAYTVDDTLANDSIFQGRVKASMVKAATQIWSEARTLRNTVDQKRNALAKSVLNDPLSYVVRFVYAVIQTGALVTASTDAQIDTAVSGIWNGIAGVTTQDLA